MQKHFGLIQTMRWLGQVNGKERQTLFANSDSEYGNQVKDISQLIFENLLKDNSCNDYECRTTNSLAEFFEN